MTFSSTACHLSSISVHWMSQDKCSFPIKYHALLRCPPNPIISKVAKVFPVGTELYSIHHMFDLFKTITDYIFHSSIILKPFEPIDIPTVRWQLEHFLTRFTYEFHKAIHVLWTRYIWDLYYKGFHEFFHIFFHTSPCHCIQLHHSVSETRSTPEHSPHPSRWRGTVTRPCNKPWLY